MSELEEKIKYSILSVLPKLTEQSLKQVVEKLLVYGIEDVEDLVYVKEEDISEYLRPIQCRKLLSAWKNQEQKSSTQVHQWPEPQSSFSSSPRSSLTSSSNVSTPWLATFQVPWTVMPVGIQNAIENGQTLTPAEQQQMIRVLADEMQKHEANPTWSQCRTIVRQIVRQYPKSFANMTCDGQAGSRHGSLVSQLKVYLQHLNQSNTPSGRHTQSRSIKFTKRSSIDSHEYTRWPPELTPGESYDSLEVKRKRLEEIFLLEGSSGAKTAQVIRLMETTYCLQRYMINAVPSPTIADLKSKWPYLFMPRFMYSHFELLTDKSVLRYLERSIKEYGKLIIGFFKRKPTSDNVRTILAKGEEDMATVVLQILLAHFEEKMDGLILQTAEFSTPVDVQENLNLPESPRLIILGQRLSNQKWMLSIEGQIVCEGLEPSFTSGLSALFASYYNFNIQYQEEAACTLEFVQRHFINIKPGKLMSKKTGRVIQKSSPIVSSLLQKLKNFERDFVDETPEAFSPGFSSLPLNNDQSMNLPPVFSSEPTSSYTNDQEKKHLDSLLKEMERKVFDLVKNDLQIFKQLLIPDYPVSPISEVEYEMDQNSVRNEVLKITLHVLRGMNQADLATTLQNGLTSHISQILKTRLRQRYQIIKENVLHQRAPSNLNEIYTELYITDGEIGEVNQEHEVKQIESAFRKCTTQETAIECNDIFKPSMGRTMLTKGVAGIGKTVSVQKFILDWAEGKSNQDIHFLFPLPFRELNTMKNENLSLTNLLHCFFPEIQILKPTEYGQCNIMFILDGLDECRLHLDFKNNMNMSDVTQLSSLDILLTNLIKRNLLSSALLWITTRPAAANQIPPEFIDQITEIQGFNDRQKQEYFCKRISDQSLACKVISHIKSTQSLYIMCHIPVFCWIAATVLESIFSETESKEIPKTLTQMYLYLIQTIDQNKNTENILALGKLAFHHLGKGNLIFYEEDLKSSGVDIEGISEMCIPIFREFELSTGKVFSFVHLSIQEFLAAVFAFLGFINKDLLELCPEEQSTSLYVIFNNSTLAEFLNFAVDKTLESETGHLDLFLRFLMGLSRPSNHTLLQSFFRQTQISSHSNKQTVKYMEEKFVDNVSPEKLINLLHCMNEINEHSLMQDAQKFLRSVNPASLSPAQWSAVAFFLLNSEEELEEFDLCKYEKSEECLLRLLPVVKESRKAMLVNCNLGEKICKELGSSIQSANNSLRELDLTNNDLHDKGVKMLSEGLKSLHCKLEILRLSGCLVTDQGCSSLASALRSNPTFLKELDLSYNHPGDSGVEQLTAKLKDPHFSLQMLRVDHAGENRMKPGLIKYACRLTLDPNTAHTNVHLSEENTKVSYVWDRCRNIQPQVFGIAEQAMLRFVAEGNTKDSYVPGLFPGPSNPERFDVYEQVLCAQNLPERSYFEAEWEGKAVEIAVTSRGINRKGHSCECRFGYNKMSWSLYCSNESCSVWHDKKDTDLSVHVSHNKRVGVYLDWPAGTLTFYSVSSNIHTLKHLHTFHSTFTEPLCAGFWVDRDSCVQIFQTE